MSIFLAANKFHKNSNKSNSATALIKSNKNHFKNTKMISNLFLSNFLLYGIILPYFPYIYFGRKIIIWIKPNNSKWFWILKKIQTIFKSFFILPTHISYVLKKSFYLLSWKSLSCLKFLNLKYFQMKFKYFQQPF